MRGGIEGKIICLLVALETGCCCCSGPPLAHQHVPSEVCQKSKKRYPGKMSSPTPVGGNKSPRTSRADLLSDSEPFDVFKPFLKLQ